MSEKKMRVVPLDLLLDYSGDRYKAAVLAIKSIRNMVDDGQWNDVAGTYNKVAGYALKKVLSGEFEETSNVENE